MRYCCDFLVKINGGRHVTGVLRGFDPFMNIVLDEAVENVSSSEKHNIGMVVRCNKYVKNWTYNSLSLSIKNKPPLQLLRSHVVEGTCCHHVCPHSVF